jgi:hypothetical protein
MKPMKWIKQSGLAACCLLPVLLHAQQVDEIKTKFPGEEAVMLNNSIAYHITIKDGKPLVESNEQQQIMFLSANVATYMSKYGFSHSSFNQVTAWSAWTKTAEGKKIKVADSKTTDNTSGSIFYDDVKETNFDFPAIAQGAVGSLEISRVHNNAHLLAPCYFSHYIPLIQGELKITFPKDMSVKYVLRGNDTGRIQFSRDSRRGETIYTFRTSNLTGEKGYADAPDNSYYALHVIFYIEKYVDEKGETISYLSNVDDLYKLNYSFIKDINKEISPALRKVIDSLTKGVNSTEEKARRIYSWVQKNIKYVAFEQGMEGFVPRDANLVCDRRFGDCKDMSSILTVMLNAAGVPAYYTWIGTRHLPYRYSETPLPLVDNHMISAIKLKDQYIFLDGTDNNCVFGTPSEGIQGKEAMLAISDKEYKIVQVPVPAKETNVLVDSTFLELTDKGIKGNIKLSLSGYYAMDMHDLLTYTNGNDREKYFKDRFRRGSNKFRLDNFEIGNQSDLNNISLTAQFDLQDYARKVADEWYLNLNLFKHYEHEEIDYPKRKIPIQFPFRSIKKYVTILKVPDDYKVSYMPGEKKFRNDVWGFELKYDQTAHQLILTQQFENEHLLLMPDNFAAWNKVLENLFPAYKENISLSKK